LGKTKNKTTTSGALEKSRKKKTMTLSVRLGKRRPQLRGFGQEEKNHMHGVLKKN